MSTLTMTLKNHSRTPAKGGRKLFVHTKLKNGKKSFWRCERGKSGLFRTLTSHKKRLRVEWKCVFRNCCWNSIRSRPLLLPPNSNITHNVFIEARKSGAISWTLFSPFDGGDWIAFHTIFRHICENHSVSCFTSAFAPHSFGIKLQQSDADDDDTGDPRSISNRSNYAWKQFFDVAAKLPAQLFLKHFLLIIYFQREAFAVHEVKWLSHEPAVV